MDEPITIGSLYSDDHDELIRVVGVWIDEDGETQIRLSGDNEPDDRPDWTVDKETLLNRVGDSLIRINGDHDAWEYRN